MDIYQLYCRGQIADICGSARFALYQQRRGSTEAGRSNAEAAIRSVFGLFSGRQIVSGGSRREQFTRGVGYRKARAEIRRQRKGDRFVGRLIAERIIDRNRHGNCGETPRPNHGKARQELTGHKGTVRCVALRRTVSRSYLAAMITK